jgi:hypothetical protein
MAKPTAGGYPEVIDRKWVIQIFAKKKQKTVPDLEQHVIRDLPNETT